MGELEHIFAPKSMVRKTAPATITLYFDRQLPQLDDDMLLCFSTQNHSTHPSINSSLGWYSMLPFTHRNTIPQAGRFPSTSSTLHLYKPIKHQLLSDFWPLQSRCVKKWIPSSQPVQLRVPPMKTLESTQPGELLRLLRGSTTTISESA